MNDEEALRLIKNKDKKLTKEEAEEVLELKIKWIKEALLSKQPLSTALLIRGRTKGRRRCVKYIKENKTMKKVLTILIIVTIISIMVLCLVGCNKQLVDLKLKFTRAYVKVGEDWVDVEVSKWSDYEDGDQLQLILSDGTILLVHSNNCILYNGTLPKVA